MIANNPTFSAQFHRASLSRLASYIAVANIASRLGWKDVRHGHIMVETNSASASPAVLIMVGTVGNSSYNLAPLGSYNKQFNTLQRAKWTLTLNLPSDPDFATDYAAGVQVLRRVTRAVAKTGDSRNLLMNTSGQSPIRLTAPIFKAKADAGDAEVLPEGVVADDPADVNYFPTSSNWPVPPALQDEFNQVLADYVFQPLHVFDHNGLRVPPQDFARKLPGALVEIHFSLRHWPFHREGYDSFNAEIEQIVLLMEGTPMRLNSYRRTAARGIYRPPSTQSTASSQPAADNAPVTIAAASTQPATDNVPVTIAAQPGSTDQVLATVSVPVVIADGTLSAEPAPNLEGALNHVPATAHEGNDTNVSPGSASTNDQPSETIAAAGAQQAIDGKAASAAKQVRKKRLLQDDHAAPQKHVRLSISDKDDDAADAGGNRATRAARATSQGATVEG